jgi:hypothetical protein
VVERVTSMLILSIQVYDEVSRSSRLEGKPFILHENHFLKFLLLISAVETEYAV